MHEAHAVSAAIEGALTDMTARATTADDLVLRFAILDPTRASGEAVDFYARGILHERGLAGMAISVETRAVSCDLCGSATTPTLAHPVCDACGAPSRRQPGPAVVCHVERGGARGECTTPAFGLLESGAR